MGKEVKLSASRLKTAKTCSWLYWAKYHMYLPDRKNDGSSRGDICHAIFECLGKAGRVKYHRQIVKQQDAFCIPSIKKLILSKAANLNVDDPDNLKQINDMIVAGLEYDFFGKDLQKPSEAYSEYEFDFKVEEDGKNITSRALLISCFYTKVKI